jgi:hypothetical protein
VKTVTVDASKRVRLGGAKPGDCYSVEVSADGATIVLLRVTSERPTAIVSRNSRESPPHKNGRTVWDAIGELGKAGLRIEKADNAKEMVPWC